MNYKILTENDLKTIWPNNSQLKLDNLSQLEKEHYLNIYNLYRKLFTEYLINKLNLKEYDKILHESNLSFAINDIESMDIYQYFTSNILKYFYIRNNIYLERLTEEEIRFLEKKLSINNYNLDEDAVQFIEKTFQKVIFEDSLKNGNKCIVMYGPNSKRYFAQNDEVIIGIRYDQFKESELIDAEWDILNERRVFYLKELLENMSNNLKNILPTSISILQYDEFSVTPLKKEHFSQINSKI